MVVETRQITITVCEQMGKVILSFEFINLTANVTVGHYIN